MGDVETLSDQLPPVSAQTSWDGGTPTWNASGFWIKWGPMLVKSCLTKRGARFGAWRRRKRGATPGVR